jgi:hypothetical protein
VHSSPLSILAGTGRKTINRKYGVTPRNMGSWLSPSRNRKLVEISQNSLVCTQENVTKLRLLMVAGKSNLQTRCHDPCLVLNFSLRLVPTGSVQVMPSWRMGCYAVWLLQDPMFRRNVAPPLSGWQESVN